MARKKLTPTFDYDPIGDVLYISLGRDDEPYYCENVDDLLLIQRHMDTGEVTGFQILEVKQQDVKTIQFQIQQVVHRELRKTEQAAEALLSLERVDEKDLAELLS